jgi:hypothetical protein
MAMTQYALTALQNSLFGKTSNFGALATAPTLYVGLSSTTPTTAGGNVTEPSGGNYARVATPGSSWNTATAADPSVVTNGTTVTFPTANADWLAQAPLTYFVLFDALTSGNVIGYGVLTVAKPVINGDTASFPASSLSISAS